MRASSFWTPHAGCGIDDDLSPVSGQQSWHFWELAVVTDGYANAAQLRFKYGELVGTRVMRQLIATHVRFSVAPGDRAGTVHQQGVVVDACAILF